MRIRAITWILVVGFAATMLGRVPVVLTPVSLKLQSLAGATVFLVAAAMMLDHDVVVRNLVRTTGHIVVATAAVAVLLASTGSHDESLPLMLYAGTIFGAASEEVVFRSWMPTTLRKSLDSRLSWLAVTAPALSFSLSHLLVQRHYSLERTGRLLLLLFVAALLYAEVVRIAGLGLAVLLHAYLNASALLVGASAHRPGWMIVLGLSMATAVVGALALPPVALPRGNFRRFVQPALYGALLAGSLGGITGNLQRAPLLALVSLSWVAVGSMIPAWRNSGTSRAASRPDLPSAPSHAPGTTPPAVHR